MDLSLRSARLIAVPVVGIRVNITDGSHHPVDSSDMAFQEAAKGAFREMYMRAKPVIMEPIMKVEVDGPVESQGGVTATLMQRRGQITGTSESDGFARIEAEVPLSEMFGFSTILRSATQGKADFTMEFSKYAQVPSSIAESLVKAHQEEKEKGKK